MKDLLPCLPYRKRQIYTCDEHIEICESLLQVEFWVYFIHFTRSGRPDKRANNDRWNRYFENWNSRFTFTSSEWCIMIPHILVPQILRHTQTFIPQVCTFYCFKVISDCPPSRMRLCSRVRSGRTSTHLVCIVLRRT